MQLKVRVALLLLAGIGVVGSHVLSASESGAAEPAAFLIEVETTGSGVNLVCRKGCAWTQLSFDCGDHVLCRSGVDGWGMTGGMGAAVLAQDRAPSLNSISYEDFKKLDRSAQLQVFNLVSDERKAGLVKQH